MVLAVTDPRNAVTAPPVIVLDLVRQVDRGVDVRGGKAGRVRPRRQDLAQITARRIASAARREELAVQRQSLWSGALELDEWRRHLAARCRGTCWRYQHLVEALAAERASVPRWQWR